MSVCTANSHKYKRLASLAYSPAVQLIGDTKIFVYWKDQGQDQTISDLQKENGEM